MLARFSEKVLMYIYYQSPKKSKKEKEIVIPLEDLSPLAQPLAHKKLVKKLHKTIKKGTFTDSTCSFIGSPSFQPPKRGK